MASRYAFTTRLDPTRSAALIAGAAGLAAGLLILWLVGSAAVAAGFLATAMLLFGVALAWRRLAPARAQDEVRPVDWSVAHALAEASTDAVAVTDRGGRLVCANDRYEALFGG